MDDTDKAEGSESTLHLQISTLEHKNLRWDERKKGSQIFTYSKTCS